VGPTNLIWVEEICRSSFKILIYYEAAMVLLYRERVYRNCGRKDLEKGYVQR